jgi:predicted HicB family RNase H-like nuclease
MGIAYHKKTSKKYIQYTLRIEETILETIKDISNKEDLSINEVINQSLQYAIDNYDETKK